jgi:hypothetical protein
MLFKNKLVSSIDVAGMLFFLVALKPCYSKPVYRIYLKYVFTCSKSRCKKTFFSGSFKMFVVTFYSTCNNTTIKESSIAISYPLYIADIKRNSIPSLNKSFLVMAESSSDSPLSLYYSPCLSHVFTSKLQKTGRLI